MIAGLTELHTLRYTRRTPRATSVMDGVRKLPNLTDLYSDELTVRRPIRAHGKSLEEQIMDNNGEIKNLDHFVEAAMSIVKTPILTVIDVPRLKRLGVYEASPIPGETVTIYPHALCTLESLTVIGPALHIPNEATHLPENVHYPLRSLRLNYYQLSNGRLQRAVYLDNLFLTLAHPAFKLLTRLSVDFELLGSHLVGSTYNRLLFERLTHLRTLDKCWDFDLLKSLTPRLEYLSGSPSEVIALTAACDMEHFRTFSLTGEVITRDFNKQVPELLALAGPKRFYIEDHKRHTVSLEDYASQLAPVKEELSSGFSFSST